MAIMNDRYEAELYQSELKEVADNLITFFETLKEIEIDSLLKQ